jgi:uncharacterized damage-inducible protein DinB
MPTETEDYLQQYERYWQQYKELLAALPAEALNWRPPVTGDSGTNSAAAIVTHVHGGQRLWIGQALGGVPAHRDREAELRVVAADAGEVLARVDAAAERVRATLAGLTAADLEKTVMFDDEPRTYRWMIVRMLAHAAEHWGELQLVRQLWETSVHGSA